MNRFLQFSPALLALALMIPRILSPQFGLFDDAVTLRVAHGISSGNWDVLSFESSAGRFRPLYWLQYTLVDLLAGDNPLWFFFWNGFVLVVVSLELMALTRRLGATKGQAWLTGVFFVTSGPVVENAYTLSKPELLQAGLLLAALLAILSDHPRPAANRMPIVSGLIGAVFFFLAALVKETSLLMLPIALAWFALSLARNEPLGERVRIRLTAVLVVAALAGVAGYFALRSQFLQLALTGGTYSNNFEWTLSRFADSAIRWSGWLIRDFAFLLPLGLLPLFDRRHRMERGAGLIVPGLVWTAAWVVIYLPWEFTVEYYMLPVALGTSSLAAAFLVPTVRSIRQDPAGRRGRHLPLLVLAAAAWLMTLPNNLSNARIQLAIDQANTRILEYVATILSPSGTVIVNIQYANEYAVAIEDQLRVLYGIGAADVDIYDPRVGLDSQREDELPIMSPFVNNQPLLTVRTGVVEDTQTYWNQALAETLDRTLTPTFHVESRLRLMVVNLHQILCPLIPERPHCAGTTRLIDTREFRYGWDAYRWTRSLGES